MAHEQGEFIPRFSYTKDIASKFQEFGITEEHSRPFLRSLDGYLLDIATREQLIAFGLLAVPGPDGLVGWITQKGGLVMDAVGYWSLPQEKTYDVEWQEMGPDYSDSPMVAPIFFQSYSPKDYSTLKDFRDALEDDTRRKDITVSGVSSHFWGLVTTEQLRIEADTSLKRNYSIQ